VPTNFCSSRLESRLLTCALLLAIAGCGRPSGPPPREASPDPSAAIDAFRRFALEPARLPPPSVTSEAVQASSGSVSGTARVVRAEDEGWNHWPGPDHRLFNHRWAWLVEMSVHGPTDLVWVPEHTRLELNDAGRVVPPAPTADDVLGDLLFWALAQERHALGDDLVARTRGAGAFRGRYLTEREPGRWEGLVAFPLGEHYDLHVVAARLTASFAHGDEVEELVWVFP